MVMDITQIVKYQRPALTKNLYRNTSKMSKKSMPYHYLYGKIIMIAIIPQTTAYQQDLFLEMKLLFFFVLGAARSSWKSQGFQTIHHYPQPLQHLLQKLQLLDLEHI